MEGGRTSKTRTQYISALVPPSTATRYEQFESDYGSTNSASDDASEYQRIHTTRSRKHREQTPVPTANISRSKSVLHDTRRPASIERRDTKHRQQLNLDSNGNSRRLKTANSRVLIDATPVQKVYNSEKNKQHCPKRTNISAERSRKLCIPVKKESNVVYCSDDRDSDYSDDWDVNSNDLPKSAVVNRPPPPEPTTSDNVNNIVPSDPAAFEASFCRKRQAAIDNMPYRQAVNSWKAKGLHDVVKLIIDLTAGKSLIDRAWIVFYWVSQNIEYDVEAYFSGNILHQTSEDIFANRKGVCNAFGTIFETLCTAAQIECKKISGYAKGYRFKLEQNSFTRTNHAWNAIRLERHWYLVDPTWGQGHLDRNRCNRKELNSFYFLVRPEQMIYRHLPKDPQWQLLMSPISMNDFVRLPYVRPTFFERNLDIIYPRHSNMASFNSNVGYAEILVRAPSDIRLIGNIKQTRSGKIKDARLVQYDVDHQLWQCLFAPQRSGFHILTLFARAEKQAMKSKTNENRYSGAMQFGLHVPTDPIKIKTFPLTYGLFTERKCQIFEPLDGALRSGLKVTIHCRIPGAYCARLKLDGNWLAKDLIKDDIFKRQITVPQREVKLYVQFSDKRNSSSYDGLLCYSIEQK